MQSELQQNFLKILFFRPDLITIIRAFLPNIISAENIPHFNRNRAFFNFLTNNGIKVTIHEEKISKKEEEDEQIDVLIQIIEEDNLEFLQKNAENNKKKIFEDSFFEFPKIKIPILQYCIIKKAMKCFKFLLLNGIDPSQTLQNKSEQKPEYTYEWDCMTIAICFGEWEIMKILEERRINKLNNPNVWEAAALTHRNNLLKLFISNKDEIDNFYECLQKGMKGAVKANNLKGLKILDLEGGADISAKYNTFEKLTNHF